MIVYGYAKDCYYTDTGCLMIRVRIPNIHGPYKISDARGKQIKSYVADSDLPYYQSLLLPHQPLEGDIVALIDIGQAMNELLVIGLTGSSYATSLIE